MGLVWRSRQESCRPFYRSRNAIDNRELCHVVTAAVHAILSATPSPFGLHQVDRMKSANELLELSTRQAELEQAMRKPGGARVIEERELLAVRGKLAKLLEATGIAEPTAKYRARG